MRLTLLTLIAAGLLGEFASAEEETSKYDVVVYGGTAGGCVAAIQVARMGKSVVVIEPTNRVGGLTTGGLGQTDIGNKAAIGGISREFYRRIRDYYRDPNAWEWQEPSEYASTGQSRTSSGEETMWTFEPSAALDVLTAMIDEAKVPVVYEERLNRESGVKLQGGRITAIVMESGRRFEAPVFIDATYEGDLLAAAGVTYSVGRESNSEYGETVNGYQPADYAPTLTSGLSKNAANHQFAKGVDPYVVKGDAESGLLPYIDTDPKAIGEGDHRVQAYCFRMCLTDHPENRIPFAKPADYDERNYELLLRNYEAGYGGIPWKHDPMPDRKSDTNNNHGFSTDFIGQNYKYPDASYAEREQILEAHYSYQQGLMWTLANHPRVPEHVRSVVSKWGTCKDEFHREDGWQQQLYVREARRMKSDFVMTQAHCEGLKVADDPVGLAAYGMDSHNVQRYVTEDGFVRNEGNIQARVRAPYPIGYGALVPKKSECQNLLVPVCVSSTHIAFGSIRMEPVFMVLGQSAGTAAVHAITEGVAVQDVDRENLREQLQANEQRLEWTGPVGGSVAKRVLPESLKGVVIDDEAAKLTGFGSTSASVGPIVGLWYRHDEDAAKGNQSAVYSTKLKEAGTYDVRISYSANPNRSKAVPVTVQHAGGSKTVTVDQTKPAPIDGLFISVGRYRFTPDTAARVTISNQGTTGHVIVDAVQFLPVK